MIYQGKLKMYDVAIVIISVFDEDDICYPQVFLEECLHKIAKLIS